MDNKLPYPNYRFIFLGAGPLTVRYEEIRQWMLYLAKACFIDRGLHPLPTTNLHPHSVHPLVDNRLGSPQIPNAMPFPLGISSQADTSHALAAQERY